MVSIPAARVSPRLFVFQATKIVGRADNKFKLFQEMKIALSVPASRLGTTIAAMVATGT